MDATRLVLHDVNRSEGHTLKIAIAILALIVLAAIVLPLLHLIVFGLVVAAAAIVVMAAWKVLFGGGASAVGAGHDRGGPPAING
jgi:hypothetical protein